MKTLEERFAALERQVRLQRLALVAVGVMALLALGIRGGPAGAQGDEKGTTLRGPLVVIDGAGKKVFVAHRSTSGGALAVYDSDEKPQVIASAQPSGGLFAITNRHRETVLLAGSDKDDNGYLQLGDNRGSDTFDARTFILKDGRMANGVRIHSPGGKQIPVKLLAGADVNGLTVDAPAGKKGVSIGAAPEGSQITVHDNQENPRIYK